MNIDLIKEQLNSDFSFEEKRNGIMQVFGQFYYDDGDMVDVFLEDHDSNKLRICDHGMTLMHLSQSIDITDKVNKKIKNILDQVSVKEENGNIYIDIDNDNNTITSQFFIKLSIFIQCCFLINNKNII